MEGLIWASPRFGGSKVFVGLFGFWLFGGGPEEGGVSYRMEESVAPQYLIAQALRRPSN